MASLRQGVIWSPLPSGVRNRLEGLRENTELISRQIADAMPSDATPPPPHGPDPHSQLVSGSGLVSKSCTKMAVLFSHPPAPSQDECGVVCTEVEQATLQLMAAYCSHSNNRDLGRTLILESKSFVLNVIRKVEKFVSTIIKEGTSSNPSKLQGTGTIWESCDEVSQVSRDCKAAATKAVLQQLHLLQDAREEAEQLEAVKGETGEDEWEGFDGADSISESMDGITLKEEEEYDGKWTEEEVTVVWPAISLVRVTADFTKEACRQLVSGGNLSTAEELDSVVEGVTLLSPIVDDLISDLPHPVDKKLVLKQANSLGECLLQFINVVDSCQFAQQEDNSHSNNNKSLKYRTQVSTAVSKLL